MSLWTPYAEAPLDLTRTVKRERRSPLPEPACDYSYYQSPVAVHDSQCNLPAQQAYFAGCYQYVPPQVSPMSGGSTCSYVSAASPLYPPPQPPAAAPVPLSPPNSPSERSKCSYMLDADAMSDDPEFQAFERDALQAMAEKNGGTLLGNNPRMRRAVRSTNQDPADDTYRKQRERNNFAAKQSRDRRKLREIHLALKVAYLKNEVAALKARLAAPAPVCARCRRACAC